jgi:putative ABC transport system permease protein
MPDIWAQWLGRLLPERLRTEMFEPAWRDLRIAYLTSSRSRLPFAAQAAMLLMECWALGLLEAFRFQRPKTPPKERLNMFLQDLRRAFRLLFREPGFTLAAVVTLALGVGANTAVFAVVEAVLLRPFSYPEPGRLAILRHRDQQTGVSKDFIAMGDYVDLLKRQSAFESAAGYGNSHPIIFGDGDPFRADGLAAAPGLLDLLRMRPALGRLLQPEDARPGAAPVMLLGYEFWQSHFGGDPHIVGRAVKVDQAMRQIVGVAAPRFQFPPDQRTDVILPLAVPLQAPAQRKTDWIFAAARLKPNVALEQANANLAAVSRQLQREFPRSNQGSEYFAVSLRDALVGETKTALVLMLAAVGLVLLIACANVANLLLARSLSRRREMAVRMALGAGRGRLVAQLVTESLTLSVTAGCAGILIAHWGAPALVALAPKSLSVAGLANVHIDGGVMVFALGIAVATTLIFGLASALAVRTTVATGALAAAGRVTSAAPVRRAASVLVAAEVALAVVLLIGAGLILRSFSRLLAIDPGFRADGVLTMSIDVPAERYRDAIAREALFQRLFAALHAVHNVREAGAAVVTPLTGNHWTVTLERPEHPVPPGERPPEVGWQLASSGYFKALQIPLLSGRLFEPSDRPGGRLVVIVSEAIRRRFFPNEDPIGREVKAGDQKALIVGVVGNIHRAGLRDEPHADMYFPFEQLPSPSSVTLFIRTASDSLSVLPPMQAALRSVEPNIVLVETRTMPDIVGDSVEITHLVLWLLAVFAGIALALAAVGIYGVMSYVVRQRTREIGTRVALGATQSDIVWLVMRYGARIATIGAAIGAAAGLAAGRALGSMLYGVSPADPITLAGAACVLLAATLVACYLPARKAAAIDPARTLAEQ